MHGIYKNKKYINISKYIHYISINLSNTLQSSLKLINYKPIKISKYSG
jgi:hypothetical protein